jgi:hypothetical protein
LPIVAFRNNLLVQSAGRTGNCLNRERAGRVADEGDFSAAGAANINYVNQLDRPIVRASAGNDGWGRIFGAASPRVGGGYLLGALEVNHNDGPWVQPDDYRKINGVLRYSRGDNRNGFSLTGMGYWADWDSTDQVPGRAISEGLIPRFGLTHFGPRPLIEDGSVNSKSTTIWNGEVGYRLSNKARLVLEAFNLFDANVSDIDYFYASRLPGEPADGVEDIHTHPALPRSARIGIQFSF